MTTLTLYIYGLRNLPPLYPLSPSKPISSLSNTSSKTSPKTSSKSSSLITAQCDIKVSPSINSFTPPTSAEAVSLQFVTLTQKATTSMSNRSQITFNGSSLSYNLTLPQLQTMKAQSPKVKVHLYAGGGREALGWATVDVRDLQVSEKRVES